MPNYFRNFPKVRHSHKAVVDITRRVRFSDTLGSNPYAFLPYTVKEGESADQVAFYYYGDVSYEWLVLMANNVIDPYYDWPLKQEDLEAFISDKYRSLAEADEGQTLNDRQVVEWTQNQTTTNNIAHYIDTDDEEVRISPESFTLDENIVASDWRPVRYYEYEFERNEDKRHIFLIRNDLAVQMQIDLEKELDV